ncbi:MAG: type IV pilus secretin PilQ [Bdellovibrionales bacterium]|nr:type IV pilus secretin PilQ [Bdellovibrionales bacterium]
MIRQLALFILSFFYFFIISCTTTDRLDTSTEDELMDLESGGSSEQEVTTDAGDEGEDKLQTDEAGAETKDDLSASNEEELSDDLTQNKGSDDLSEESMEDEFDKMEDNEKTEQAQNKVPQEEPSLEQDFQAPQEKLPPASESAAQTTAETYDIKNIKYLASQNGGSIVVETTGPALYQVRSKPDTHQFVVELQNSKLPSHLKRPYLLKEFDASFAAINAYQNVNSTTSRIVIQLKPEVINDPIVQQEGNTLVVMPSTPTNKLADNKGSGGQSGGVAPINEAALVNDEKALMARSLDEYLTSSNKFYGRPLSIEVQDQDIRDVLDFIARDVGLNMVMSEDVQGKITLKLRDIPWDQALVTIMKSKKLGYVRQGAVIRISTLTTLQEENDSAKRILDSQKILAPLRVKVIPVSYAAVEDLSKQIPPFLTQGRGQIVIDNRTSSLIITDTEDVLERVFRLVRELDIPPAQVMIEGKVVEAMDNFSQSLGLNWRYSGNTMVLGEGKGANGADLNLFNSLSITNLPDKTAGAGAAAFGTNLTIGRFDIFGDINAALSMAEGDSQIKILSSPRIVTMNKEKANITQKGQVITVQSIRDLNTVSRNVVRNEFSLELTVTPQITAEGSVIMDVQVRREFPGAVEDQESLARPINSRSANTKILVNDGQTAVIGGIYSSDKTTKESGVPWLRHLPVLGWLFKSRQKEDTRNELLIFLTPKVLNVKDQAVEG